MSKKLDLASQLLIKQDNLNRYQEYVNLCNHYNIHILDEDDNWIQDYDEIQLTINSTGHYY